MDAEKLQARINAALRETPEETAAGSFSPYIDTSVPVVQAMMSAAREGGVEAALDLFDERRASTDPGLLRDALIQFLISHPGARELGLRVPSRTERAPWTAAPSNRKE